MPFNSSKMRSPLSRRKVRKTSDKWIRLPQPDDDEPRPPKGPRVAGPKVKRKGLRRVGKKGAWWLFVSKVQTRFLLQIGLEQRCEACDGTAYCGPLTPAHRKRRQDIPLLDWTEAFRIAVLGAECHLSIDKKGRRLAEPIIEKMVSGRYERLGLSEEDVKRLLIECSEAIKSENPGKNGEPGEYDKYVVEFE